MLKPRRAFEFPSSWNCVAIEQRTQIFANEQIFEIKYKINLSINVSEPDLNPSTNFGFGLNLFPVKRPQICLSFKCFSRSSYSTFSVILSFPLQFWQKLVNISPIALPDLTVIYIFAIIFQQIHILLYHCMIIVTSYMFSSRCIRSIVFIEIHCEYVTFDRCTGCLHSHKKITWRSAPVFGTCLTSLPLLDAFGQKNRRMLAGIVCEFPRFWKWKCEGIAKTKEDICHISTMSCYRETKGRTNFFTIF